MPSQHDPNDEVNGALHPGKKAATIYDVAKLAGVSHQTVTRFLHGFEGIRPATRDRVEAAIQELGYRPNAAARMLRLQRNNRIGILADRIADNGPTRIVNAASEYARSCGYVVDIAVSDGGDSGSVASSLAVLTEHHVAGILATAQTRVILEQLQKLQYDGPLVVAPAQDLQASDQSVNELAGALAAEHLLSLGHQRFGYLSGPEPWLASQGRAKGFVDTVKNAGATIVWQRWGDWTPASGYEAWQNLNARERKVTAVGIANDRMAIGLIASSMDAGLLVPQDLSVVGTDDAPEARYLRPSLTTVKMQFEQEGHDLMKALIARIEDAELPKANEFLNPLLVVRNSTCPL